LLKKKNIEITSIMFYYSQSKLVRARFMTLTVRCNHAFDQIIKLRGNIYYDQKKVLILKDRTDYLSARINGTAKYEVELSNKGNQILLSFCSCPYYVVSKEFCKHIWATLIAVDKGYYKFSIPGTNDIRLDHTYNSLEEAGESANNPDENSLSKSINNTISSTISKTGKYHELDFDKDNNNSSNSNNGNIMIKKKKKSENNINDIDVLNDNLAFPSQKGKKEITRKWEAQLNKIQKEVTFVNDQLGRSNSSSLITNENREIRYYLNLYKSTYSLDITIDIYQKERLKSGKWGKLKTFHLNMRALKNLLQHSDYDLLSLLITNHLGERSYYAGSGNRYNNFDYYSFNQKNNSFTISPDLYTFILPKLCATGRFGLIQENDPKEQAPSLLWDGENPYQFKLKINKNETNNVWQIDGILYRYCHNKNNEIEEVNITDPFDILNDGLIVFNDRLSLLNEGYRASTWITEFKHEGSLEIPFSDQEMMVSKLLSLPNLPSIELPAELNWEQLMIDPIPHLFINNFSSGRTISSQLVGNISFEYRGQLIKYSDSKRFLLEKEERRILDRNQDFEQKAFKKLIDSLNNCANLANRSLIDVNSLELDKKSPEKVSDVIDVIIDKRQLSHVVSALSTQGWIIKANGKIVRSAGNFKLSVKSGIDWFDLSIQASYNNLLVDHSGLLSAMQANQQFITLDDGTLGVLPEEWLKKFAPVMKIGVDNGTDIRYSRSQAVLLDALLETQPEVETDKVFSQFQSQLKSFEGIRPQQEPPSFQGTLRPYQREGLGWLNFLKDFGIGGCLADDMGLGKTIQVLALLSEKYIDNPDNKYINNLDCQCVEQGVHSEENTVPPSLIVVPKSLVQNWIQETTRFAKSLKCLEYAGNRRRKLIKDIKKYNIVITTYNILRRDIDQLREVSFYYAILDEAQAIKNANSQVAKASRLITANHRLALTGTPIENNLNELWSLFEFLNPGFLSGSPISKYANLVDYDLEKNSLDFLTRALKPFILRRTKEKVLSDLPPKTTLTLYCDLDEKQRKYYTELKNYYQSVLATKIDNIGLNKSKIVILEALLRLRQAACHPGLVDRSKIEMNSGKMEVLLGQILEIINSGHKALIFSQFTSMLSIVRNILDEKEILYEYLDGKTSDRQARVDRFQSDPACPLFLISIKAGGLGLNLTAADYCFILDPWWNPAVESQAIDRAHRIGQTKKVFAYRLIAKDTVEEKILKLQEKKQKLADSIISSNSGNIMKEMSKEDLQLLLS